MTLNEAKVLIPLRQDSLYLLVPWGSIRKNQHNEGVQSVGDFYHVIFLSLTVSLCKEKENGEGMKSPSVSDSQLPYTRILIYFIFVNLIKTRRKGEETILILCVFTYLLL